MGSRGRHIGTDEGRCYRLDDPDGEVGIEGLLLWDGIRTLHVPLTYRGAPAAGSIRPELIGTCEHSVLGNRWVYDGATDPVAVRAISRVLTGLQRQAVLELWDGDRFLGQQSADVTLSLEVDESAGETAGGYVTIARTVEQAPVAGSLLRAVWDQGSMIVAALQQG